MIEENYFRVIYQHFEEGLFDKQLSMEQALQLARLIMRHAPREQVNKLPEAKSYIDGQVPRLADTNANL